MGLWDDFRKNVEKIQRCHKEIAPEYLETKYKKSYVALKKETKEQLRQLVPQVVYSGVRVRKEDMECGIIEQMKEALGRESDAVNAMWRAASVECDANKVMLLAVELHEKIVREHYAEYWLAHCKPCNVPRYSHYNDIIHMWYSTEHKVWECEIDGVFDWGIYFPPTKEGFYRE